MSNQTDPLSEIESFLEFLDAVGGQHLDRQTVEDLRTLDNSQLGERFMERLEEVVEQVQQTGRKGKIKLNINMKLAGNNQITFEPSIKTTVPKIKAREATLFTGDDGEVRRSMQNQTSMAHQLPKKEEARSIDEGDFEQKGEKKRARKA